ncbi:stage V sporulation protein B [Paenibacillus methanolicus]|uniref:Stage V sporulation protein B n=1 Tax=Paenibacillus methanolicus TaxID=582686 RepID=A0A5S5C766_9BACL|nr:stage V sporulation protein B [Paenibacillus methanolicus]TYP73823.1 stage V sporulation protein B [Paenibacillus methanolicus]
MTKQTFIKGALILLVAGVLNRILGFVPRIALPRIIGAEGVGLYQLVYPFLIVMLTVITGGIPLAVAKWIAEAESKGDARRVKQIFRAAMALSVLLALGLTVVFALLIPWISTNLMTDSRVYRTLQVTTPLLLIIGVGSVYRGYFQGKQNMIPTAVSQTVETIIRIIGSLLFASWLLPYGIEWGAAGAMLGVVAGEIAALAVLLWNYKDKRAQDKDAPQEAIELETGVVTAPSVKTAPASRKLLKRQPILRRLIGLSVPVTASKLIGSFSYLFESILTARALAAAGLLAAEATALYGALQGMIIPILLLPTALTYSLAVSLVPNLSEAAAKGDRSTIHKRLHQSMRLSLVTGAPFIVVMGLFAEPICLLLYDHADIAPMLKWMAPIGLFIYLQAPLQAALQALDKPGTALLNTLVGAIVKLVLIVELASQPELGIYGALIAINVNIALVTILHWFSVMRAVGFKMQLIDFVKVGAAMIIMGAASLWIMNRHLLPASWHNLLLASILGGLLYIGLMIKMGIVSKDDIARIPVLGKWFRPRTH